MSEAIESLELQISSDSKAAVEGIDLLSSSLLKLKESLHGGIGLARISKQIKEVGDATRTINTASINNIDKLTGSLQKLANIGNINIPSLSKLNSQLKQSQNATTSAGVSYINLWAKLRMGVGAVKGIVGAIGNYVNKSNQYIEDMNLFNATMGQYTLEAQRYGEKVSEALGIDPGQWMRNQGIFNTIIEGFGVASDKAYIMSKNLTQLGYDLSSFFNISYSDAMKKISSGISGELEPLRRLGYDLSMARLQQTAYELGIHRLVSRMTQAEKAQLRYYAIMKQVTVAQGDMARTINSPSNQLRVLSAQFILAARAVGNAFIPMLNAILPIAIAVTKIIALLGDMLARALGFKPFRADVTGIKKQTLGVADNINSAGSGAGKLSRGMGKAAEKAKELKTQLLGIDELNILHKPEEPIKTPSLGGVGTGKVGGLGSGGTLNLNPPIYKFLDKLNNKATKIFKNIKKHLGLILGVVKAIGLGLLTWTIAKTFLNGLAWIQELKKKGLLGPFKLAVAISLFVASVTLMVESIKDAIKNGLNKYNFSTLIAGAIGATISASVIGKVIGAKIAEGVLGNGLKVALESYAAKRGLTAAAAGGQLGLMVGGIGTGAAIYGISTYDQYKRGTNPYNIAGSMIGGATIGGMLGVPFGPIGIGIGALGGALLGGVSSAGIEYTYHKDKWDAWQKKREEKIQENYIKHIKERDKYTRIGSKRTRQRQSWWDKHINKPLNKGVNTALDWTGNKIREGWNATVDWTKDRIVKKIKLVKDGWKTVAEWTNRYIGNPIMKGIGLVKKGWKTVANWTYKYIGKPLSKGIKLAKKGWSTVANWTYKYIGNPIDKNIKLARNGWSTVAEWVSRFNGGIIRHFAGLKKYNWSTVASWVSKHIGGVVDVGINLVKNWVGNIKDFLGLSSGGIVSTHGFKFFEKGGYINANGSNFWDSIPKYENGVAGLHGSMFLAGENGAEMVGHVNGQTEVLNQSQISVAMTNAVIQGMAQFTSYWDRIDNKIGVGANEIIKSILTSANMLMSVNNIRPVYSENQLLFANVSTDKAMQNYKISDTNFYESLKNFYKDCMEQTIKEIAYDTKRQANKNEKTVVQIGTREITESVKTQQDANGFSFTKGE